MTPELVTVRIFGESYPLRTDAPERLEEVARFVDARMREVAATGKVVVTAKIAVLAALHIADELVRLRGSVPGDQRPGAGDDDRRLAALAESLDRALHPPHAGG